MNIIAINKISDKLKVWSSKTRTTHSQTVSKNAVNGRQIRFVNDTILSNISNNKFYH